MHKEVCMRSKKKQIVKLGCLINKHRRHSFRTRTVATNIVKWECSIFTIFVMQKHNRNAIRTRTGQISTSHINIASEVFIDDIKYRMRFY